MVEQGVTSTGILALVRAPLCPLEGLPALESAASWAGDWQYVPGQGSGLCGWATGRSGARPRPDRRPVLLQTWGPSVDVQGWTAIFQEHVKLLQLRGRVEGAGHPRLIPQVSWRSVRAAAFIRHHSGGQR